MAHSTGTIAFKYTGLNDTPSSGVVEVFPSGNVKRIVDSVGNVIMSGRLKVTLDETGAGVAVVPASDDLTLNPSGVTYTVIPKLHSGNLPAVSGIAVATGATVQVADVDPGGDVDPPVYAAQVTRVEFDALVELVGEGGGGGGGVTDHGDLTGLGDDDHTQYLTNARGDARYDAIGAASSAQTAATSAAATDATNKVAAHEADTTNVHGIADTSALATTSSVTSAVGVETTRATAAEALKAPIASPTFTGTVSGITKSMVGLGSVDNTADASKPVSTAQAAADTAIGTAAATDATTKANAAQTAAATDATTKVATETTRATTAEALLAPKASPTFTGTVSGITATHVGLGNVDNTSDANKPVSTAQQTALNLKANLASPTFTGTVAGISKSMVGLGNVDNTADASKTFTESQVTNLVTDLAAKAPLASPTLTGTPAAPTAAAGTNTTQLATTAYVVANFQSALGTYAVTTASSGAGTYTIPTVAAVSLTITGNVTLAFTAPTAGHTVMLRVSGAFTLSFPASVKWDSGAAPTYTTPALYVFTTLDGGTTWLGSQVGKGFA